MRTRSRAMPPGGSLAIVVGSVAVIVINSGMLTSLIALRAEAAGVSTTWNGILAAVTSQLKRTTLLGPIQPTFSPLCEASMIV